MVHIPGIKQRATDGLSRHPVDPADTTSPADEIAAVFKADPQEDWQYPDIERSIITAAVTAFNASPITSVTWDLVCTATASDETLNSLL